MAEQQGDGSDGQFGEPAGRDLGHSGQSLPAVRLLVACKQPRERQSLKALLTALRWSDPSLPAQAIEIVGEAHVGLHAVEQVQALQPHVVLLDLPTPASAHCEPTSGWEMNGLSTIRTIKARWPAVRVVVLTLYATDRAAALLAGADVFLLKGCAMSELLDAVVPPQ